MTTTKGGWFGNLWIPLVLGMSRLVPLIILISQLLSQTHEALSMARRPTSSCLMLFEGVDGGEERACRGSTADDNSEEYFQVKEAQTLETWMILDDLG